MSNGINGNMQAALFHCGRIKRTDLRLRMEYYGLETRIYLLESGQYSIQILNYRELYQEIKQNFDSSIRSVGDWVEVVSEKPENSIREISPLANVTDNEGFFLTFRMLESLLISRFTDTDFRKVEVYHEDSIRLEICLGKQISSEKETEIKDFVLNMQIGFSDVKIYADQNLPDPLYVNEVNLACTDSHYKFSVEDSEFWFDNVNKIYSGDMTRESLRFWDPDQTKCYMDFGVWQNKNINIRSAVLLYDKVYIAFPLDMNFDKFLEQQHLMIQDLYELVEQKKLVLLLPNTENRYNRKILEDLYGIDSNCVVSKRGINALLAMYYCELEKQYMEIWKGKEEFLQELCKMSIKTQNPQIKMFSDMLLWPIRTRIKSFEMLTSYGPSALSAIGVNKLVRLPERDRKNIEFELTVNAPSIHIATALQSTYFPFYLENDSGSYSDAGVATILGNILNMYNYLGKGQLENIEEYSKKVDEEKQCIYLLKPENSVDMKHILAYEKKYHTSHTLKRILEDLASLDSAKRTEKVKEYNNAIAEAGLEKMDAGMAWNYVLSAGGFIPGIGTGVSVLGILYQMAQDLGIGEKYIIKKLEQGTASERDKIYLLDKINRVAQIRISRKNT